MNRVVTVNMHITQNDVTMKHLDILSVARLHERIDLRQAGS